MRILSVRKKIENDMLIFYCKRCGKILDATEDLDYAGTDGCEVWEVELNNCHEDDCKPTAEWLEKVLSPEDIAKAKELAEIARSFGEVATWEEIAADFVVQVLMGSLEAINNFPPRNTNTCRAVPAGEGA